MCVVLYMCVCTCLYRLVAFVCKCCALGVQMGCVIQMCVYVLCTCVYNMVVYVCVCVMHLCA